MERLLFVPHGARGAPLLDCKAVINLRDWDRIAGWLYQLLGYAWLDSTADQHTISETFDESPVGRTHSA